MCMQDFKLKQSFTQKYKALAADSWPFLSHVLNPPPFIQCPSKSQCLSLPAQNGYFMLADSPQIMLFLKHTPSTDNVSLNLITLKIIAH